MFQSIFTKVSFAQALIYLYETFNHIEMCNKQFAVKNSFKRHLIIRYTRFSYNSALEKGSISHAKEKSFVCDKCNKVFSRVV